MAEFSRVPAIVVWVLQAVLATAFLAAGGAKLAGVEQMVQTFDAIGVGQWFRYVTAVVEIASGAALLLPGYAAVGAVLLVCTMVGAVITHLFVIGGSAVPALVLLVLAALVLWLRRGQLAAVLGR